MTRVDRAAFEIAVDRDALVLVQLLGDLGAQALEDVRLGFEVAVPVGLVELLDAQLVRDVGVPGLQWRPALGVPGAQRKQRQCGDREPRPACAWRT